jgi:zeaxanthin glucosyltransferase
VDLRRRTSGWGWQIPFAWRRLPLLVLQARELDLPSRPSPLIRHVGPMIPPPAEADEACAAARTARGRVVYAAFGTLDSLPGGFVPRLWEAARRLPDWTFVHSAGGRPRSARPPEPPANVHLVEWAAQRATLRFAHAAVIHAGVNSLVDCVEAGVPMLCHPAGKDQPGNAARVAYHGLGLVAAPDAGPAEIAAGLQRLVSERGFADRLAAMRAAFARYDGVAEAEVAALLAADTPLGNPPTPVY